MESISKHGTTTAILMRLCPAFETTDPHTRTVSMVMTTGQRFFGESRRQNIYSTPPYKNIGKKKEEEARQADEPPDVLRYNLVLLREWDHFHLSLPF